MSPEQAAIVQRLQRCVERSVGLAEMPVPEQQALLAERQTVLDAVQGFDTSGWASRDKQQLCAALEQLLQSTQSAAALLQTRLQALTESRHQVAQGREALRGYRPDMKRSSRSVDRRA